MMTMTMIAGAEAPVPSRAGYADSSFAF